MSREDCFILINQFRNPIFWIALIWGMVSVPMIFLGFGSDLDSWLAAFKVDEIIRTGIYSPIRFPSGSPLYDFFIIIGISLGSWVGGNLVSLLAGGMIFKAMIRLGNRGFLNHGYLSIVALMFLPIFLVNATSTMDYVTALAFLVWAYVYILEDRAELSAVLIGLAFGCRVTSCLYAIPALIYLWRKGKSLKEMGKFALIANLTGWTVFAPSWIPYGVEVAGGYGEADKLYIAKMGTYWLITLFGLVQWGVIAGGVVYQYFRGHTFKKTQWNAFSDELLFHCSVILIYTAVFFIFPHEVAYLLPIVPSIILLMDKLLDRRIFAVMTVVMLSYHVIGLEIRSGPPGQRYFNPHWDWGMTIQHIQNRRWMLDTRQAFDEFQPEKPSLIMFGMEWTNACNDLWMRDEDLRGFVRKDERLILTGLITDEAKLKELKNWGFQLYVWKNYMWAYQEHSATGLPDNIHLVEKYITVFDDLATFLGKKDFKGKPMNHEE